MKKIKYRILREINRGTDEAPDIRHEIYDAEALSPDENFEADMASIQARAYGEVIVEDIPDEQQEPTQLDRVEAQVTYTAMMTDTLLEG